MTAPAARTTGTLLAIDTATTRVVVARGGFDGTLEDAADWPAGYRHGECAPARDRATAGAGGRQDIDRCRDRRHRPGRVHRTARRARDGQGAGPRPALPDRRRADGPGTARRRAGGGRACCCPRDPPTACWSAPASRRGCCPRGTEPELRSGERLVAVDLDGRAPEDALAAAARPRRAGRGAAPAGRRTAGGWTTGGRPRARSCPRTWRCRAA